MTRRITFKGEEFLLVGGNDGAIATQEQYENGLAAFAYLLPDGRVLRFGQEIGTEADIRFLEETDVKPKPEALANVGSHPSWLGPMD